MAIPDYQTLMLPLLRAAAEEEKKVADVADQVADQIGLTSEERVAMLPSGRQKAPSQPSSLVQVLSDQGGPHQVAFSGKIRRPQRKGGSCSRQIRKGSTLPSY